MAAAWQELKILQTRHGSVQRLCWIVLGRRALVEAFTVQDFYENASTEDLTKARAVLRNLRFATLVTETASGLRFHPRCA